MTKCAAPSRPESCEHAYCEAEVEDMRRAPRRAVACLKYETRRVGGAASVCDVCDHACDVDDTVDHTASMYGLSSACQMLVCIQFLAQSLRARAVSCLCYIKTNQLTN